MVQVQAPNLLEHSKHVHYEVWMLRSVVEILVQEGDVAHAHGAGQLDIARRNALLESFCVHLRNVLDFMFRKSKSKDDDVLAVDFFHTPDSWRPQRPSDYDDLRERVHKEIVHLTSTRFLDPQEKQWEFVRIFNAIFPTIDAFQNQAPPALLDGCWQIHPITPLQSMASDALTASSGVFPGLTADSGATNPYTAPAAFRPESTHLFPLNPDS